MTPEAVATSLFNKFFDAAVDKVWTECAYVFTYKSNITGLETDVGELKSLEGVVKQKLAATGWTLRVAGENTVWWKGQTHSIEQKGNDVLERAKKVSSGCFRGRLNLKQRYLLGKEAAELIAEIKTLRDKTPQDVALEALPPGMLLAPATEDSDVLNSQKTNIENVMNYLMTDDVYIIGIWGMPGVGKNWLANKVRNMALSKELVHEAPMIVVSEKSSDDIRDELAEELKLPLVGTNTDSRRRQLYKRLSNGSKILVVFDKVLEPLELEDIGLPKDGGLKGLKVLFTSEKKHSHTPKDVQKYVNVKPLPRDESWTLLKMMVGDCVETEEFKPIAESILEECEDLPIAIKTIGMTLANGKELAWMDARRFYGQGQSSGHGKLQTSVSTTFPGIHLQAYEPIKLSYKLLGCRQPHAERLLMLCCLFPKDVNIPVEKLIRYTKGLPEFTRDEETLEETTFKVMQQVEVLKNCSLLEPGDKENTVKMHNVVRNVCLSFASDDRYYYVVTHHPAVREWPHKDDDNKLHNAISFTLTDNEQKQLLLPAGGLDYPNLVLLQLQFQCDTVNMPTEFFYGMKKLRVLDCKGISRWRKYLQIQNALPTMPGYLWNMRSLSLEFCDVSSGDLSMIGNLLKLEILSFFSSKVQKIPSEIKNLSNLKLLDLRCAYGPKEIPSGLLSELKYLEDLYMGNYDSWIGENEQNDQRSRASLTEISSLPLLKTLQVRVQFPDLLEQLNGVCFEKLKKFQIIGIRKEISFHEYEIGKCFLLDGADWHFLSDSDSKISNLLKRCEHLTLKDTSFNDLFKLSTNLKTLDLSYCNGPEFIINEMESATSLEKLKHISIGYMDDLIRICEGNLPTGSLFELETVKLDSLCQLTHLWSGPIKQPCLGNLRVIEISDCEAITNLFPISVAKCLVKLERLDIQGCEMLEGIVSIEGVAAEPIPFPKLSFLSLDNLPNFQSFFPDLGTKVSISATEGERESMREKGTAIHGMQGCFCFPRKQHARPSSMPDVVITEILTDGEDMVDGPTRLFNQLIGLPSMNKLLVRCIKNLKHIVDGKARSESFSKLRVMHVDECENLLTLVTPDSIGFLRSLEQIDVQNCTLLDAVFDLEGFTVEDQTVDFELLSKLESISLNNLEKLKHLWRMTPPVVQGFKNLQSLEISNCCSLTYVFSISVAKMLKNLQRLEVKGCPMVEEIIEIERSRCESLVAIRFPELADLQLDNLKSLTSFSSGNYDFEFPRLERVLIRQCPKMNNFCWGHLVKNDTLIKLETVELDSLPSMMHLWRPPIQHPCLRNLSVIRISNCEAVKCLFPISVAKCLVQLRELCLNKCARLDRIVFNEGVTAEEIVFPKLSSLLLEELPNFRSFFIRTTVDKMWPVVPTIESNAANQVVLSDSEGNYDHTIQPLFNQLVVLPSLKKLVIRSMNNLKRIVDGDAECKSLSRLEVMHVDECQNLMNLPGLDLIRFLWRLKQVDVRNCKSLEVVFDLEGFKVEDESTDSMLLSKLDSVSLHNLDNVKHLWRATPHGAQGFKHLRSLEISSCHRLTYVLPISVAKMLENLQQLHVKSCDMVEEIIQNEGGRHQLASTIIFRQLYDLRLDDLKSLKSFSSAKHHFKFLQSRKVFISQCPMMKTFCCGLIEAPELNLVEYGEAEGQGIWKDNLNETTRYLHDQRFRDGQIETSCGSASEILSMNRVSTPSGEKIVFDYDEEDKIIALPISSGKKDVSTCSDAEPSVPQQPATVQSLSEGLITIPISSMKKDVSTTDAEHEPSVPQQPATVQSLSKGLITIPVSSMKKDVSTSTDAEHGIPQQPATVQSLSQDLALLVHSLGQDLALLKAEIAADKAEIKADLDRRFALVNMFAEARSVMVQKGSSADSVSRDNWEYLKGVADAFAIRERELNEKLHNSLQEEERQKATLTFITAERDRLKLANEELKKQMIGRGNGGYSDIIRDY